MKTQHGLGLVLALLVSVRPATADPSSVEMELVPGALLLAGGRAEAASGDGSFGDDASGPVRITVGLGPWMLPESVPSASGIRPGEGAGVRCDVAVPVGSDWGDDPLSFPAAAQWIGVPVLAANVMPAGRQQGWPENVVRFVVVTAATHRVLLCGLASRITGLWLLPSQARSLRVVEEDIALLALEPQLQSLPADVRVLFVEKDLRAAGGPFGGLADLLQRYPYFDVVVGMHGSRFVGGQRIANTWFIQPGAGNRVSVRIDFVPGDGRPRISLSRRVREECPAATGRGGSRSRLRGLLQRMLQATGAEVAVYPDPHICALREAACPAGPVDGSRLCLMRIPYQELRRLMSDEEPRGRIVWYSEAFPEFNSFRAGKGRGAKTHPRRKIRVCTTSRMAASYGGRFPRLRRLALDPHCELSLTRLRPRDLVGEAEKGEMVPPR